MADDEKKSTDEYQYPSDEYYKGGETPESLEPLEPEERPRRRFLSRRMLIVIGFIVAIAIVYLFLTLSTKQKTAELSGQQIPAATVNVPPQQPIPRTPVTQVATPMPTMTERDYQEMVRQNQINQQAIANLQSQMQQLQSQLSQVTNSMSTLANQIQIIANEVKAIAVGRSLMGREMPAAPAATVFRLKALVPGRAWIQSATGQLTSVTIGDRLPGYGIIQMINTDQGIVTTSSGAVIQYGSRDR